jgi:dephospho-CoA kinase
MLLKRGFPVVDADQIARDVLAPGESAFKRILERFGSDILYPDGTIDRRALGRLVFDDDAARADLNAIVHPAIARRSAITFVEWSTAGHPLGFYDAALLFETGSYKNFPLVLVVAAPVALQLQRLAVRDPDLSERDARARIDAQMPLEEKVAKADIVIRNDADLASLEERVEIALVEIHDRLSLSYPGTRDG